MSNFRARNSITTYKIIIGIIFLLLLPTLQPLVSNHSTHFSGAAEQSSSQNLEIQSGPRSGINREVTDSEVMYAIIAPANFTSELIPLINWKTYKGVPAKLYTLESIYANYTAGRDDAENIHMFLRWLKSQSSVLQWLLLVGDADVVPIRKLWAGAKNGYGLDDEYVSDYYYASLKNDWDGNKDGKYGDGTAIGLPQFEGHWTPDVYVGRLPVGNITELNISINDILKYVQSPPIGDWMRTYMLWGGLMNAPNVPEYDPNSWNAYKAKELMVKPVIMNKSWNPNILSLYDYAQLPGGNYVFSEDKMTRTAAKSMFNAGASILNFAGQAYYSGHALLHYNDPLGTKLIGAGGFTELFYGVDGEISTNGMKLPLVTAITCGAGNFAETAYEDLTLERLLVAPNGGAIGLVGSTGKTYRGEMPKSDGNWWLDREFYEIFFNNTFQPGRAMYKLKESYVSKILDETNVDHEKFKAMLFGMNYQGDPELNIWTDWPHNIDINITGLWLGPHNITATIKDEFGNPEVNARIVFKNSELYAYGATDSNGIAKIFANPTQLGSVDVVVTGHNFLPVEKSYTISVEPPDLTLTANDIEFSNNNPIINQQITINATIKNRGQTPVSSPFKVRISLDDLVGSGGSQIGSDQTIASLAIGDTQKVSVTWDVLPGSHEIFVEIDPENEIFESYEWNNIASKTIYITRPELYVTSDDITFTPDPATQDVYEGSAVDVNVIVYNIGETSARDVVVKLGDWDYWIQMVGAEPPEKIIPLLPVNQPMAVGWTLYPSGGEHEITITVDPNNDLPEFNENNNTASKNITLKYPPVINPIPDIVLNEDPPPKPNAIRLHLYIRDNDTNTFELDITVNCSDENCSIVLNEYLGLDLSVTQDWFGNATVIITASDGGVTVNRSFKVIVNPEPDAPRFNETNYTLIAVEDIEFVHFVKAYDPDLDSFTFNDDFELFEIDESTGEIRFIPTQEHVNNSPYHFNITISDGNLETKQLFELQIKNSPDPPILLPVADQYGMQGKRFELQIVAVDIDSTELFFYDDSPSLFAIDKATGLISFIPTIADVGSHVIKITVSDETYLSDNMTFRLYINASDDEPPDNEPNGDDKNESKDDGSFLDDMGGMVVVSLIIILIVVIILIMFFLLTIRKRKMKTERDKFFSPDYDRDKLTEATDKKEGEESSASVHPKKKKLSYEDEYKKLYSTEPATKPKGKKESITKTGRKKGTKSQLRIEKSRTKKRY